MSLAHLQATYEPLSNYDNTTIAIIVANWHKEVTEKLYQGAYRILEKYRVKNIQRFDVSGSFELSYAANHLASYGCFDAIICIGVIIQGETKHFDFICQAVANGITKASQDNDLPIIFGVLTPNTIEQALERAGGKYGNKGEEAAYAALQMIDFRNQAINFYQSLERDIQPE
ncbi:MAG: 6,7-dimethyl-8-ribityllumazine synthase [Bacteroidia bacterium]|nr:MAG: 6,7-dimethyl-8-ribityllumazine synthase [Bacteroidia bacterium]